MVALVYSFYYEGGETTIFPSAPDEVEVMLPVGCAARETRREANSLGEIRALFY